MGEGLLASAIDFLLSAAALALAPVLPLALATRIVNGLQDARTVWTPHIEVLALIVGVAGGVIVFFHNVDPGSLGAGEIFRRGGPWDLDVAAFLSSRGNPLAYSFEPLLPWPYSDAIGFGAGTLVFLLIGAVAYAPALFFRSPRAIANGIRNVVIAVWAVFATCYGLCYALWLLNQLNFWAFLVLLWVVQLARSRSERVVLKLN
ncbi:hypothetical protein [Arenibaculum sp.]|jgi:hypothetical protein|uniref:hypothetical protein n=1 Tax=Arenibaculum sp. TaxID=2865862 RepID=UPI002E1238AF|nr:hypothetical protein [Arenibaculum sp.]